MIEEGMDFDDALALATELGYAEADRRPILKDWMQDVR